MKVTVGDGVELECRICGSGDFEERKIQLNTRGASFFNLDWLNKSARCFICEACGNILWFDPSKMREPPDEQ